MDGFQPSPSRTFQADVPVPLALLLEHMQSKPSSMRLYLAQKDVHDLLPELAVDPDQLPFRVIKDRLWQQSLWLGPEGTKTPLHRDPYSNLLCQVNVYHVCASPEMSVHLSVILQCCLLWLSMGSLCT